MAKEEALSIVKEVFKPFDQLDWYNKMIANMMEDEDYLNNKLTIYSHYPPHMILGWLFYWEGTPEKGQYWSEIYDLLYSLFDQPLNSW